jgi:hypothetical protein
MNKNNIYIPSADSETPNEIQKEPGHLTFLKIAKYALIVCIALFLTMVLYRAFQSNKEQLFSIIFITKPPSLSKVHTPTLTPSSTTSSIPINPSVFSIPNTIPKSFNNEFENSALNMLKKLS